MEWEYFVHTLDLGNFLGTAAVSGKEVAQMLNWYGAQGWELVSNFSSAGGHGSTVTLGFIFKRQKQPGAPAPQPPATNT